LSEHKLILGDCLDELPKIFDKTIDLILTDPPYGTTACKWDFVIPFEPMWKELKRVIKDNGCIALFGSEPFSSALRMSNIKQFKYDWIWEKDRASNFGASKYQPLKYHEIISIFYNKNRFYPQKIKRISNRVKQSIKNNNLSWRTIRKDDQEVSFKTDYKPINFNVYDENYKYPSSIIYNPIVNSSSKEKKQGNHPTQKPIALLEYLIKTYTNENDTVLDFTMGSGSTGVACKNLNRNFIGIEKDQKYFDIAKQRIEGVLI
jgi:site-specific DNA-methyltransferase (adenine-specific)